LNFTFEILKLQRKPNSMAITFEEEEKKSPTGIIFTVIILIIIIIVGGYFGFRYLWSSNENAVIPNVSKSTVQINKSILSDPRLDSLELMPETVLNAAPVGEDGSLPVENGKEIEIGAEFIGKDNPFSPVVPVPGKTDQQKTSSVPQDQELLSNQQQQ